MPLVTKVSSSKEIVSEELLFTLEALAADNKNSVYVLSGKPKQVIDGWFSSVKNLGLAAEYGYHFRPHGEKDWIANKKSKCAEWEVKASAIFAQYRDRTDGSNIEAKDNSLVWVYKECDPELGNWQANDLKQTLKNELSQYHDITIIHGKGFVEVRPKNLQKGKLAASIIREVEAKKGKIDFVFCIGDDIVDEEMFKKVNAMSRKEKTPAKGKNKQSEKRCHYYTCTVGKKPSYANYYVNDYLDTLDILQSMNGLSIKVFFAYKKLFYNSVPKVDLMKT